ncbi:MAG: hypothetical protein AABY22_17525, partial [Nanoarchaeota archaeon]
WFYTCALLLTHDKGGEKKRAKQKHGGTISICKKKFTYFYIYISILTFYRFEFLKIVFKIWGDIFF